ncbi:hypothetical protein P7K49_013241 [Saguinus oedipus]|uniref:Uncharacterized protein n=1 Tax=Saguinus oedipus TaxID=9490 RepID=A0ABQ9VFL5_SAGOE|nr:hypothetical protein P7K49_013241 [Saguinus oedipus]
MSVPCGSLGGKLALPSQDRGTGSLTQTCLQRDLTWCPEARAFAHGHFASSVLCPGLSGEPQIRERSGQGLLRPCFISQEGRVPDCPPQVLRAQRPWPVLASTPGEHGLFWAWMPCVQCVEEAHTLPR